MVERVVLVHGDRGHAVDGIRDYTLRLADELAARGGQVEVRPLPASGPLAGAAARLAEARQLRRLGPRSAVVLQYSPFCFARWGFAPWLPLWAAALRTGRARPRVAVMVHEPYVPMTGWRWRLMGLWQRFQLSLLRARADVAFTSIAPWAAMLERRWPRRAVRHLPVGSNLPDRRSERGRVRQGLDLGDAELVVAALGRDHPSWLREYAVAAVNAIAATGIPVTFLCMGAEAPPLSGLDGRVRLRAPGFLEAGELASHLAAADLFLAPLIDGVSTRRGALMAALQHALPVVGTSGPLTDSMLRDHPRALRLTAVGDVEGFATAALALAADATERSAGGSDARALYGECFDWPVIADRLLVALGEG